MRDRNNALIEAFDYDATGNRLSKSASNGVATGSYNYPPDSHRLSELDGIARSHDGAGNLTAIVAIGANGFVYDARNRMTQSQFAFSVKPRAYYDYNARGERVWRQLPDYGFGGISADASLVTRFVYDESGRLLGEYTGNGTPISEIIWLDDLPVGVHRKQSVYPVESDHLGSPRVIANGSQLLWHWDLFGPVFGEHAPNDTISGKLFAFDLRFPGQQYDAASGLHYNYFRDYEAGAGRYVESDPIGLGGGVSTYGYALADPLAKSDPLGLITVCKRVWKSFSSGDFPFARTGGNLGGYWSFECGNMKICMPTPSCELRCNNEFAGCLAVSESYFLEFSMGLTTSFCLKAAQSIALNAAVGAGRSAAGFTSSNLVPICEEGARRCVEKCDQVCK